MKNFIKAIAPYITAILMAIGVYVDLHTKVSLLDYQVKEVKEENGSVKEDVKSIKDLLYSIDTRLSVYSVMLDERTLRR